MQIQEQHMDNVFLLMEQCFWICLLTRIKYCYRMLKITTFYHIVLFVITSKCQPANTSAKKVVKRFCNFVKVKKYITIAKKEIQQFYYASLYTKPNLP